jgi:hypothetical protein
LAFFTILGTLSFIFLLGIVPIIDLGMNLGFTNICTTTDGRVYFWIFGNYFENNLTSQNFLRFFVSSCVAVTHIFVVIFDQLNTFIMPGFPCLITYMIALETKNYFKIQGKEFGLEEIKKFYRDVYILMKALNATFSPIIFGSCALTISYITSYFIALIDIESFREWISYMFLIGTNGFILTLAAQGNCKVKLNIVVEDS